MFLGGPSSPLAGQPFLISRRSNTSEIGAPLAQYEAAWTGARAFGLSAQNSCTLAQVVKLPSEEEDRPTALS